jgi:glycogen operon protein
LRFGSEVSRDSGRLSLEQYEVEAHYEWHGIELGKPDWKDDSHAIAFTFHTGSRKRLLYVAVNAFWGPLSFALPASGVADRLGWQRLVDTSLASPDDIVESESGVVVTDDRYLVNPRSLVVLQTRLS